MSNVKRWLSTTGRLGRYTYASVGFLLFAVKYNLDRGIAYYFFGDIWYIQDYFTYFDKAGDLSPANYPGSVYVVLAFTAIPFVYIGTLLTIRRLRDIGLPQWLVVFFFLPLLNLLFFGLLCLLPSGEIDFNDKERHKTAFLTRVIPKGATSCAVLACAVTAVLALVGGWFSMNILREYGWTLFLGIPFMQGMSAALIYGYHVPRTIWQSITVAIISLVALGLFIFVLAMEGVICIIMAAPLALALATLGASIGFVIQSRRLSGTPAAIWLLLALPLLSGIEKQGGKMPALIAVTTEVKIHGSPQQVWNQLVTFNEINEPKEFIFRSGIAYPIKAEIDGHGVGSVRRCIFTTGAFVEPIKVWDEPHLLAFSVKEMPPPLVEMSIYQNLHLPHLHGYFTSVKGEFKLIHLANGQTLLQGTTWYHHNIWPAGYWRLWSDYILHTIHKRVLNHIKLMTEKEIPT